MIALEAQRELINIVKAIICEPDPPPLTNGWHRICKFGRQPDMLFAFSQKYHDYDVRLFNLAQEAGTALFVNADPTYLIEKMFSILDEYIAKCTPEIMFARRIANSLCSDDIGDLALLPKDITDKISNAIKG